VHLAFCFGTPAKVNSCWSLVDLPSLAFGYVKFTKQTWVLHRAGAEGRHCHKPCGLIPETCSNSTHRSLQMMFLLSEQHMPLNRSPDLLKVIAAPTHEGSHVLTLSMAFSVREVLLFRSTVACIIATPARFVTVVLVCGLYDGSHRLFCLEHSPSPPRPAHLAQTM
jgi:hypothetical protein